jgi:hypothetical protein
MGYKTVSDEVLQESYRRTGNMRETGREVGLEPSSVRDRVVKLGIHNPRKTITDEIILASYQLTDNVRKTGETVGLNRRSVRARLLKMGVIKRSSRKRPVPDEVLLESYRRTNSVWKTGEEVGLCGQSVHERLVKLGENNPRANLWTQEELDTLRELYSRSDYVVLEDFPKKYKRHKVDICAKAASLGMANMRRPRSPAHQEALTLAVKDIWERHPHPKGFAGHKMSAHNKERLLVGYRAAQADPDSVLNSPRLSQKRSDFMIKRHADEILNGKQRNPYSRCKQGRRDDLGLFVRSSWEANYARYLNLLKLEGYISSWEYEPDQFVFEDVQVGFRSYIPDFKVWTSATAFEYHEVKGWMNEKSRAKLDNMTRCYPDVKLLVIDAKQYRLLEKQYQDKIPGWEVSR